MLNEKYGYKKPTHFDQPGDNKEVVKKQNSESSLPDNSNSKSSSSYSGSNQPYSSKRDRQDKRSSYRDPEGGRHYSKSPRSGHHHHQRALSPAPRDSGGFRRQISTPPSTVTSNNPNANFNMAASMPNFSASMINSPAFMATMTSMLSNMAQQGVNVNAILNQMPNLLASFDQKNLNSTGFNQYNPADGRDSNRNKNNKNNNSNNNNRNYFPKRGGNNGGELIDDPLLPNPTGFGAASGTNPAAAADSSFPNFSKAFYSYLSSFAQSMGVNSNNPGMMQDSAAQFNSMLNESGLEANFNEFYNNANRWDQSAGYNGNQGAYGDNRYYGNGGHHDNYLPGEPYYDNYDNYQNQNFNPPPNYNNSYNNNNHKNNKGHNFNNKYNNNNKRKRH